MIHHLWVVRTRPGFTLIELLVVVAIIAILAAIAIPNFLGFRTRAYNSSVKAELNYGRIAMERYHVDWETYGNTLTSLQGVEVSLAQTRGVTFASVAGGSASYTIVAYHQGGNRRFTATDSGIK
jgi:prepilin-type N-terminal cleavage/methylation domain-containing protein